jgi:hypothetical protein
MSPRYFLTATAGVVMAFAACRHHESPRAEYVPLRQIEATYGTLITAGNHPTPNQHGTGERVGVFRDSSGTLWGLPLALSSSGNLLGCAPRSLPIARVTDTFPAGSTVIGAANEPTGWRDGTGNLELLLRDAHGVVHWQAVASAQFENGPACYAPQSPGPPQKLAYYRLIPAAQ